MSQQISASAVQAASQVRVVFGRVKRRLNRVRSWRGGLEPNFMFTWTTSCAAGSRKPTTSSGSRLTCRNEPAAGQASAQVREVPSCASQSTRQRVALSSGEDPPPAVANCLVLTKADADLANTLVRLNQTQTAYQAALQSGGKILSTSLLDYLR